MTAPLSSDPGLKTFLNETKGWLEKEILKAPAFLQEPLKKIGLKGKGLRSSVLYLCAEGADLGRLYPLAAALELLHLASLIHDDLIDSADWRRGEPAIHRSRSAPMAILIGDLLFAQVFGLVAENLSQKEASGLSQIVRTMIQSELLQFHHRYDTKLSVRQYRRIIAGKTAGLFALSAAIGGHMGNKSPEDIQNLRKGGYAFGMGFQIQDDYLDLWGSTKSLGKPTGQDWHQGQYGFPLILGFQKAGANILNAQDDFGRVGPKKALEELGVQRITQSEIERYFSLAQVQWGRVFSQSRIQLGQELLGRAIQRNH